MPGFPTRHLVSLMQHDAYVPPPEGPGGGTGTPGPGTGSPESPADELAGACNPSMSPTEQPWEAGFMNLGGYDNLFRWDFGTDKTTPGAIKTWPQFEDQFQYQDRHGHANLAYIWGSSAVARTTATSNTGLGQPVDGAIERYRELAPDRLLMRVQPLLQAVPNTQIGYNGTLYNAPMPFLVGDYMTYQPGHAPPWPANQWYYMQNNGDGSFWSKFMFPQGGGHYLGKHVIWETKFRIPVNAPGAFFTLWLCGERWQDGWIPPEGGQLQGPANELIEAFDARDAFYNRMWHSAADNARPNERSYLEWTSAHAASGFNMNGFNNASLPSSEDDLRYWHTWTCHIRPDDSFTTYVDHHVVQWCQPGRWRWDLVPGVKNGVAANANNTNSNMGMAFEYRYGNGQVSNLSEAGVPFRERTYDPTTRGPLRAEIAYSALWTSG